MQPLEVMFGLFERLKKYIYLNECWGKRGKEKKGDVELLSNLTNVHNIWVWARPKSGGRHSSRFVQWLEGAQLLESSSSSPGTLTGKQTHARW